jgi:hypothetical protein
VKTEGSKQSDSNAGALIGANGFAKECDPFALGSAPESVARNRGLAASTRGLAAHGDGFANKVRFR